MALPRRSRSPISVFATAGCRLCGRIPARRRRWCSTRTTRHSPFSAVPARAESMTARPCPPHHWRSIGSLSKTCLVRFDNNRYSVDARAVGRPVEIRAYADRLECWQDGQVVGRHDRAFGRAKTIYDPLHYIPVLARKPGALRNGAPFKDWDLPQALRRVQRKLERQPGGDRQVVDILGAVLTDGLDAVEAACAEALSHNVHSAGVVLNILARHREPPPPLTIATPDALKLGREPAANCDRYDSLRRPTNGTIAGARRVTPKACLCQVGAPLARRAS